MFAEIDSPIALAFLKRYPSPADAHGLGEQRMARFLARHHYCGRKPAGELLGRLRGAAYGRAEALETEARRQIVLALVAALEPIVARISELTSEIRAALADHADGPTFRSLFNDPKQRRHRRHACSPRSATAATATPPKPRWPPTPANAPSPSNPASANTPASAGPATTASEPRSARSPTAAATTTPGRPTSTPAPARAAATHQHAIRILGRAWCGVIWRLWHDHTTYDPTRHTALQQLLAARG